MERNKICLTVAYEGPTEDGWVVARVLEVPGAFTQGRTREEARENIIDALQLMLTAGDDAVEPGETTERLELLVLP